MLVCQKDEAIQKNSSKIKEVIERLTHLEDNHEKVFETVIVKSKDSTQSTTFICDKQEDYSESHIDIVNEVQN